MEHAVIFINLLFYNVFLPGYCFQCGADYIKLEKKFPRNFDKIQAFERCAAFDGDVDRLVYFYRDASNEFVLIDGDKIAALFAKYIKEVCNSFPQHEHPI